MKKIAIIGASYLQEPLITKAKKMGIETHVFAWKANDVGERIADYFYPISIIEKEEILKKCKEVKIDGICSIASDLAMVTVNYVANQMNLQGNSDKCTLLSTNKHYMRNAFQRHGDPSPKSYIVESLDEIDSLELEYPIIIKPTDRSGSRGITKLNDANGLKNAIINALELSFEHKALVEEYVSGKEYSVECISYHGNHTLLAVTQKYTTGSPNFIETAHLEPAMLGGTTINRIKEIVFHALDSLEIKNGASHTELKIDEYGNIKLIEIGGRMGGDFIGSNLVELSTGVDFVKTVIDVALGGIPQIHFNNEKNYAGVRFVFSQEDIEVFNELNNSHPEYIVKSEINDISGDVVDSSTRFGYYLLKTNNYNELEKYMPFQK